MQKDRRHKIHFDVIYKCGLSSHEVEPMIGVSSSLMKPPKIGYDTVDVVWAEGKEGTQSKPLRVSHKFDTGLPWPRDAAIWFQVFAKVRSSEGKMRFEKAGSGVLHLANLVPEHTDKHYQLIRKGDQANPRPGLLQATRNRELLHKRHPLSIKGKGNGDVDTMVIEIPLVLQSMRVMKEEPVYKGKLIIRAANLPACNFRPPTKYDLVPGNTKFIESSMMALVKKNLMVFKDEIYDKMDAPPFKPISDEIDRVHAPLFITAQGVLPGEYYWANLAGEVDYDPEVYLNVARVVLQRYRISEDAFIAASSDPEGLRTKAAPLFGEMTSTLATTLAYIADYADLNDDRRGRYSFSKQKSHITVESFDDAMMRHADDCEGLARLNARTFMGLRDGSFRHPLLKAVQSVARRYVGAGTLGSVTSRNIAEAEGGGGPVKVESDVDKSAEIGAHMWFSLLPKRKFLEMVSRTSPSTRDKIAWGDGSTIASRPEWESDLPVMISEGTGMLHPLPLSPDAYARGKEAKIRAVNADLLDREAYARVMTDCTLLELKNNSRRPDPPGELGRLQILRTQQMLLTDPDARVSSFYRIWSALFPVLEAKDDVRWQDRLSEGLLPDSWKIGDDFQQRVDTGDPSVYTWRYLVPVQLYSRWKPAPAKRGPLRWGVHTVDMLHKRDFVGLVRMGGPTSEQEKIISAYARHLPPQAVIKKASPGQKAAFQRKVEGYNKILKEIAFGGGNALSDKQFFGTWGDKRGLSVQTKKHGLLHLAKLFIKGEDSTEEQIKRVANRLRGCPYVIDARVVGEMFEPQLNNLRIDMMVSISDPAQVDPSTIEFLFEGQA
jgi:hypothetical protein